jgi:hypothetical protein
MCSAPKTPQEPLLPRSSRAAAGINDGVAV